MRTNGSPVLRAGAAMSLYLSDVGPVLSRHQP